MEFLFPEPGLGFATDAMIRGRTMRACSRDGLTGGWSPISGGLPHRGRAPALALRPGVRYFRRLTAAGMRAWWNWQTRQI